MRRDEQMLEWFSIVRIANVQTVRWVLGALNGWSSPVSTRQAQSWCSRMRVAGLVGQAPSVGGGGSVVWGTFAGVGSSAPNLYRQTTRHEIAVAAASARFATAGYAWQRDGKAEVVGGHQADGVAFAGEWVELVEVELTAKRPARYAVIFEAYRRRFDVGDGSQVTYLSTAGAARAVRVALETLPGGRRIAGRVRVREVFDSGGLWTEEQLPEWLPPAGQRVDEVQAR